MILYYILVPFAWLLWHIGFRIHVEGRENLKKVQTKGCILAPTHVSAIDPVFIVVTRWSRRMIVFAKKELFEITPCSHGSSAAAARCACAAQRMKWLPLSRP